MRHVQAFKLEGNCQLSACRVNKNGESRIAGEAEETYYSSADEREGLKGRKRNSVDDSSLRQNTAGFGN